MPKQLQTIEVPLDTMQRIAAVADKASSQYWNFTLMLRVEDIDFIDALLRPQPPSNTGEQP